MLALAPELAANEATPWLELIERINVGGYLVWVAALAVALLRRSAARHPSC